MPKSRIVALLTDFGLADTYVGQMKGVLLGRAPSVRLVDLTHDLPRGDVRAAAFALLEALDAFPRGTIFLCVVDPAVGTGQARLAVRAQGRRFVAPDNGLLTLALEKLGSFEARRLSTAGASNTFHGRDVFAPAAAHLAAGGAFSKLGACARDLATLDWPQAVGSGGALRGEVVHVDRFGNLITNLRPDELPSGDLLFGVSRRRLRGLSRTYGDVPEGEALVLVGSHGFVEVAVNGGSAARGLSAKRGTRIKVQLG